MTAPAGTISLAREYLRTTLADAAAFRTWVGATTQAAALKRIHYTGLPNPDNRDTFTREELEKFRPFVLIWTLGFANQFDAIGSQHEFDASGRLRLLFQQDVPPEIANKLPEIDLRFENSVGLILADVCGLAGTAGYLAITGVFMDEPTYRVEPNKVVQLGDFVEIELDVTWGRREG